MLRLFSPIGWVFGWLMFHINEVTHNYGLTLIIFTVIVSLFMMQCQLPAKITFCPAENTVFSVVVYILLYGLCGILLYASAEAVYLGIYHDAALFWMMIYTMISVSSGRINRKKTGDGK